MTLENQPNPAPGDPAESVKTPSAQPVPTLPVARIALIMAALIAVVAIGLSLRNGSSEPGATTTAQTPQKDVGTAIAELEKKLKDNPNDAQSWQMLGWAFSQTQKYAEAAQAYARATQLEPKNADHWSALGEARVLAGSGVPPEAKIAFDKAIALDPKDPRARYFLAVAKDVAGDHKGAIDDWFALLTDTPAGAPWESDVRRLISEVGATQKIEVASRLAALRPAAVSRGAAIATAGIPGPTRDQMQAAAQLPKGAQDAMISDMVDGLEAKLKTNPNNESGWIMLMRSRVQLGEARKSVEALENARRAFSGNAGAVTRINEAAAELGIKG